MFMVSAMAKPGMQRFAWTQAFSSRQAKEFVQLRANDQLTDFTILSGTKSYRCHRVILASCSPVLKAMMMSGMKEATKKEVRLDNISPPILELLIDYMYRGAVDVPDEHLLATVEICDYLQLLDLKERCLSKAVNVFNLSNIVSWYKLADSLGAAELKKKSSEKLSASISEVAKQPDFLKLSLEEVASYAKHVADTSGDPDDVLVAVLAWISYNPSNRRQCMKDLLKRTLLLKCSVECLKTQMKKYNVFLAKSLPVRGLLSNAMVEITKQDNFRQWAKPRTLVVVNRSNKEGKYKACLEFTAFKHFAEVCRLTECRDQDHVCQIPGGFIVTGGQGSDRCSMYVIYKDTWTQLDPFPLPRNGHTSILIKGKIYVFGGFVSRSKSTSVLSLKLDGGEWTMEPYLPFPVCYPEVAFMDAKKPSNDFMVGMVDMITSAMLQLDDQFDGDGSLENARIPVSFKGVFLFDTQSSNQLLFLDAETNTWSRKAPFPGEPCWGARMITIESILFLAGGRNKIAAVYNPFLDKWYTYRKPSLVHHLGTLVCHRGQPYLIGGENENRVEKYDKTAGVWSLVDDKLPQDTSNPQEVINCPVS